MFGFGKKSAEQPRLDRRESCRVPDGTQVDLLLEGEEVVQGCIVDVSDSGLRLSTQGCIAPGTRLTAHLPVPGRVVAVCLEVVRSLQTEGAFESGLRYVNSVPCESMLANYWLRLLSLRVAA